MNDTIPTKNRKGLLVFFGILTLLGGLLCFLFSLAAFTVPLAQGVGIFLFYGLFAIFEW